MTEETDKQFLERCAASSVHRMIKDDPDYARLRALALRGAETQWKVIEEVAAERRRQIEVEGWTPQHDDEHERGEMAQAAACYAMSSCGHMDWMRARALGMWPWAQKWWKPKGGRPDLIRAAALLVAEIERLDRIPLTALGEPK